jgi:transposase-like protein
MERKVGGRAMTKWKDLTGEERYQVVEMALAGKAEVAELCRTFEMSRQTLYRAMDKASKGAAEALEPKLPGRKSQPLSEQKVSELQKDKSRLEKELKHMTQRYEVAKTILELERKIAKGESLPGETPRGKKVVRRLRRKRRT